MKNNRNSVVIGIFVTTTILLGCALAFFAVNSQNKDDEVANNSEKITEYETKINELNNEVAKYKAEALAAQNQLKNQASSSTDKNEITTTSNSFKLNGFQADKCLNNTITDNNRHYIIEGDSYSFISSYLENNRVYIQINGMMEDYKNYFEKHIHKSLKVNNDSTKVVEITGFSKQVVDVYVDPYPEVNPYRYPVVLFLMEDGTVEYLNTKKALEENELKSSGKIADIDGIVSLRHGGIGGRNTDIVVVPLAIKEDGSFYDLNKYLDVNKYILSE